MYACVRLCLYMPICVCVCVCVCGYVVCLSLCPRFHLCPSVPLSFFPFLSPTCLCSPPPPFLCTTTLNPKPGRPTSPNSKSRKRMWELHILFGEPVQTQRRCQTDTIWKAVGCVHVATARQIGTWPKLHASTLALPLPSMPKLCRGLGAHSSPVLPNSACPPPWLWLRKQHNSRSTSAVAVVWRVHVPAP